MSRPRPIIFDIDGVLADFVVKFTALAGWMFKDQNIPTYGTLQQQQWNEFQNVTPDIEERVWEHINQSNEFWKTLPLLVNYDEVKAIQDLNEQQSVYFVSSRTGETALHQTRAWVEIVLGVRRASAVISKNKGDIAKAVDAQAVLEDRAENAWCVAWITGGRTNSYLIDRPYNRYDARAFGSGKVIRVASVTEFLTKEGV